MIHAYISDDKDWSWTKCHKRNVTICERRIGRLVITKIMYSMTGTCNFIREVSSSLDS